MEQHMEALQRANEVRAARFQLRKAVKAGEVKVAEVLLAEFPDWLEQMPLEELCNSIPRFGWRHFARAMQSTHTKLLAVVGDLTARKRAELSETLAEWECAAEARRGSSSSARVVNSAKERGRMTLPTWETDCGCTQQVGMGQKREKLCEHKRPFVKVREDEPQRRSTSRAKEPKRDWTDARAKVEEEGCCRICKRTDRKLEAAHILGREHDEPKLKVEPGTGELVPTKTLHVEPDRIVPLCGPFPEGCHGDVGSHRVNLVHVLTLEEQLQAVKDAGGIAAAWRALAPVDYRAELVDADMAGSSG